MKFLLILVALVLARRPGGGRGRPGSGGRPGGRPGSGGSRVKPCSDATPAEVQTQLGEVASSLFTDTTSTCYLTIFGDEGWPMYTEDDESEPLDGGARRNLKGGPLGLLGGYWAMAETKITITDGTIGAVTSPVFTKQDRDFACYDGLSFTLSNPCKSWGEEDVCVDEEARRQLRRGGGRRPGGGSGRDRSPRPTEPENFVRAQFAYDKWDEPVELTCTTYLKPEEGEGDAQVCVASELSCSGMYGSKDTTDEPSGKVHITCRSEDWDKFYWEDALECPAEEALAGLLGEDAGR